MNPRLIFPFAGLVAGPVFANASEVVLDHHVPAEIRKGAEDSDGIQKSGDFVRLRVLPAKPKPRLERLAEDAAKMARHCEKTRERREAIAKGARVPDEIPRIVSMERLSTGLLMLAWEGTGDIPYTVESFDREEQRWQREALGLLVHDGVAEWAETTAAVSKYYHLCGERGLDVFEDQRLSGEVTFREAGGVPVEAIIKVSYPDGRPADDARVSPRIDGEGYGSAGKTAAGVYRMKLPGHCLLPGKHFFSADLDNRWETTPEGNEPGHFGGWFRTPTVYFELPGDLPHHFPGFRATSTPPDHDRTEFEADLAPHYRAWEIEVRDLAGRKVRAWTGETDRLQGSSLSVRWNHRDEEGKRLPSGDYEARLKVEFEEGGKTVRRCIARSELSGNFGE